MFNLFKRNKTSNLTDFYNKVLKLAESYGKDHCVVRVEYNGIHKRIEFSAYVPSVGWTHPLPTVKNVLDDLKDKRDNPKEVFPVKEVLINE